MLSSLAQEVDSCVGLPCSKALRILLSLYMRSTLTSPYYSIRRFLRSAFLAKPTQYDRLDPMLTFMLLRESTNLTTAVTADPLTFSTEGRHHRLMCWCTLGCTPTKLGDWAVYGLRQVECMDFRTLVLRLIRGHAVSCPPCSAGAKIPVVYGIRRRVAAPSSDAYRCSRLTSAEDEQYPHDKRSSPLRCLYALS